jgi:hypothetical protein
LINGKVFILVKKKDRMPKKQVSKEGFPWTKLAYIALVVILYIPLVFIGVRTFLPEYTDYYDRVYKDCYMYQPSVEGMSLEERVEQQHVYEECYEEQRAAEQAWEEEKRGYDVWKYLVVLGIVFITLGLVIFVPLDGTIRVGLFVGAAISIFVATMQYFETESKLAFVLLVVVFGLVLFVIQKREKFFK